MAMSTIKKCKKMVLTLCLTELEDFGFPVRYPNTCNQEE